MAGKRKYCKSGGKRKKAKGRRAAPCRKIDDSNPNWYGEIGLRNVGDEARNIREAYGQLGIEKCNDFKKDAIPCRYMPMERVRTYGGLCEIKGRSNKSKAQLCAALARRNHMRAVSQKCGLQRMAQVYATRAGDPAYADPRYYDARVMHKILKTACIHVPKHASRELMQGLISRCVRGMEAEKKRHVQTLAQYKLNGERRVLALKDPTFQRQPDGGPAIKADFDFQKKQLKTNIETENRRHKVNMEHFQKCAKAEVATSMPPLEVKEREQKHQTPGQMGEELDRLWAQRRESGRSEKQIKEDLKREQAEYAKLEKEAYAGVGGGYLASGIQALAGAFGR